MPLVRSVRHLPWFRVLTIVQLALLARRHLSQLDRAERRRLAELAGRGHRLTAAERGELRALASKLEAAAFVRRAAGEFSPVRFPRRFR